jgi:hypothetical protein
MEGENETVADHWAEQRCRIAFPQDLHIRRAPAAPPRDLPPCYSIRQIRPIEIGRRYLQTTTGMVL